MRTWAIVLWAAGCSQAVPRPAVRPPPAEDPQVIAPVAPRTRFDVVAAELGDPGVLDRIRHRVRVRRVTTAVLRAEPTSDPALEPLVDETPAGPVDRLLPVIGERRSRIRVVLESDAARYALWIARADTWPTVVVPIQLARDDGRAARGAGVWLAPGAPVELLAGGGARRRLRLRDDTLDVTGSVPASAVGNVWQVAEGDRTPTQVARDSTSTFRPPADPRPPTKLAEGAQLREAPQDGARVIATVKAATLRGAIVARVAPGAWTEVEVIRPYARIRGYVRAAQLVAPSDDDLEMFGTGSGGGFGMSHSQRHVIPTGTCLFDLPDGEVIGVQLAPSTRHGDRRSEQGWVKVYVWTPWDVAGVYVRDTSSDGTQPAWESCLQAPEPR